jgi:DNA repair protein RecO (recombination protein O)
VTLFTRDRGKITCVAKGARKLSSSKLSALEPGCEVKLYCIETKSLPILTQAQIINDFSGCRDSLVTIKKLFQTLEIVDFLLPEGDEQSEIYDILRAILNVIEHPAQQTIEVRPLFNRIIEILGFHQELDEKYQQSIHQLVEELTTRKMKSFEYLTVRA